MRAGPAFALLALSLAGCASPPPPTFAAESVREGVVVWRSAFAGPSTATIRFEQGSARNLRVVVFEKAPRLTLTRAKGEWFADGPPAAPRWHGPDSTLPSSLAGWVSVAEAFEAAPYAPAGNSEMRTGRWSARFERRDGALAGFELVSLASGERFRVSFPSAAR